MMERSEEEPSDIEHASRDAGDGGSGRPIARRSLAVIAGLVLLGVFLNLALWAISLTEHRGLLRHDDLNLSTLVVTEQRTLRLRYGFEAYLHDLAREGILTVPDADVVDTRVAENLSQVEVIVADYDGALTEAHLDALAPGVTIAGLGSVSRNGEDVEYRFLVRDEKLVPAVTYFTTGSEVVIIDNRLLAP